jgi:hypothetical protein
MAATEDVNGTELRLGRSLTRIEFKLDSLSEDHEGCLRRTERILYVALGVAAAGAMSGIGTLISALVN